MDSKYFHHLLAQDEESLISNTEVREFLYDRGMPIPTAEMHREFYLRTRISKEESFNLIKILRTFEESRLRLRSHHEFALLAVGTSTYAEDYYIGLQKYFSDHGLSEDDFIEETTSDNYDPAKGKSYEEYLAWLKDQPFEEQEHPLSQEQYDRLKQGEQKDYSVKKRVGAILNRRGEDLDFVMLLDETNPLFISKKYLTQTKDIFFRALKNESYDIHEESSFLAGAEYTSSKNGVMRLKSISGQNGVVSSFRIIPDAGRSLHFYFRYEHMDAKLRNERIKNLPFATLLRKSDIADLETAINNGLVTGVYENPFILKWKR